MDHLASAEELCKTAFPRRDLLATAVMKWPRPGNVVLIAKQEFMGSHTLSTSWNADTFMSTEAVGVEESGKATFWVSSHGRWCPSYYYDYHG